MCIPESVAPVKMRLWRSKQKGVAFMKAVDASSANNLTRLRSASLTGDETTWSRPRIATRTRSDSHHYGVQPLRAGHRHRSPRREAHDRRGFDGCYGE